MGTIHSSLSSGSQTNSVLTFVSSVHSMQTQYIKDPSFYDCIGVPTAAFGTINPHVHRARRSILNPMFSKRRITEASAIMEGVVQKFCGLLDTFCEDSRPVPLSNAFYCVTVDIISTFTFGTPWGMLDEKDFTGEWVEGVLSFTGMLQARIHFPKVLGIMETLGNIFPSLTPLVFVKLLQVITWLFPPHNSSSLTIPKECNRCVKLAIDQDAKSKAAGIPPKERPETIYDALLNPVSSKAQRPSVEELVSESISMVTAGTDTSATVLQCCVWNILTRTEVRETLLDELSTVRRDTNGLLPLKQLEELPYLVRVPLFSPRNIFFANTPLPIDRLHQGNPPLQHADASALAARGPLGRTDYLGLETRKSHVPARGHLDRLPHRPAPPRPAHLYPA